MALACHTWTVAGFADSEIVQRHVAIMRRMDMNYQSLTASDVCSGMSRRRGQLHFLERDDCQLSLLLYYSSRRESFYIWSVGLWGSISPRDAADLAAERLCEILRTEKLDSVYAIRPYGMDYPDIQAFHDAVSDHPLLEVRVVDKMDDSVLWRLSAKNQDGQHPSAVATDREQRSGAGIHSARWVCVEPTDNQVISRFVEMMRPMASRLADLDPATVVSALARRRGELHYCRVAGSELAVTFLATPRRQSYYVCVGMAGDIAPSVALDLVVEHCLEFCDAKNLDALYCIKRPMDYPPIEELHRLVDDHLAVQLTVVEQCTDLQMWKLERRFPAVQER